MPCPPGRKGSRRSRSPCDPLGASSFPASSSANTISAFANRVIAAATRTGFAGYLPLAEIATVTQATADAYADIRLELKRLGTPIPPNDAWIAALARQHAQPVLSNDAHFDVVGGVQRIAF